MAVHVFTNTSPVNVRSSSSALKQEAIAVTLTAWLIRSSIYKLCQCSSIGLYTYWHEVRHAAVAPAGSSCILSLCHVNSIKLVHRQVWDVTYLILLSTPAVRSAAVTDWKQIPAWLSLGREMHVNLLTAEASSIRLAVSLRYGQLLVPA